MENHLTEMFADNASSKLARTPPGMAHFAGSGPEGVTCRTCDHWIAKGHYSMSSKHKGALKPGKCSKYQELMSRWGPAFRHSVPACKHYVKNPNPPKVRHV